MNMSVYNNQVPKLYRTVVDDVINNVRESFLDDGVDDQVLMELRVLWENKLQASRAVEPLNEPQQTLNVPRTLQQPTVGAIRQPIVGQGQLPVFAQLPGASRPQATIALPAVYSQQFAGQQILQTDQGTIILQAPGTQIIRTQMADGQIRPIQHVIQQGGQQVTTASGMIQLDGTTDKVDQNLAQCPRTLDEKAHSSKAGLAAVLKPGMMIEGFVEQMDGQGDSSSEDDDDDDDDDKDDDEERDEEENEGVEEEPLNSDDDVSEEDPTELFDTENVIVCQYDKINRCKNKWKFGLKDGIMNLNGRDYVFQRASGDAEW